MGASPGESGHDHGDPTFGHSQDRPVRAVRSVKELEVLVSGQDELGILVALYEGDPLGLVDRSSDWMCRRCYLLDARQLATKTLALVAADAPWIDARVDLDEWIEERIEDAGRILVARDCRLAREGGVVAEPLEPRLQFLTNTLGIEPATLWRACVIINGLQEGVRHAFHNLLVQKKGFGRYAREVGIDPRRARELLTRAIDAISRMEEEEGSP